MTVGIIFILFGSSGSAILVPSRTTGLGDLVKAVVATRGSYLHTATDEQPDSALAFLDLPNKEIGETQQQERQAMRLSLGT